MKLYIVNHNDTKTCRSQYGFIILEAFVIGMIELIPYPDCFMIDEYNLLKAKLIYGKLIDNCNIMVDKFGFDIIDSIKVNINTYIKKKNNSIFNKILKLFN